MTNRTMRFCDRAVVAAPTLAVTLPAKTTITIDNDRTQQAGEIAGRYLTNIGTSGFYFCVGTDCDGTNVHGYVGIIGSNNEGMPMVDLTDWGLGKISVYSINGTIVSPAVLRRTDFPDQGTSGKINQNISG
jgi:hypothetical protein